MAYNPLQIGGYDSPDTLGMLIIDFKFQDDKFELFWSLWNSVPSASRYGSKFFNYNKIQSKLSISEADSIIDFIDDLMQIYPSINTVVIPETTDLWEDLIDGFVRDCLEFYHDLGTLEPEQCSEKDDVELVRIYNKTYKIDVIFEREQIKSLASLIRHEHYLEKVMSDESPME